MWWNIKQKLPSNQQFGTSNTNATIGSNINSQECFTSAILVENKLVWNMFTVSEPSAGTSQFKKEREVYKRADQVKVKKKKKKQTDRERERELKHFSFF